MEICRIEEFETMNFEFYVEKNAENLNSHMHVHKYTEMIIFTKGTAVHAVEDMQIPVRAGSVSVIVPGIKHCFLNAVDTEYYIFSFDLDRLLNTNYQLRQLEGLQAFFISTAYYRYRHIFASTMELEEDLSFVEMLCNLILQVFLQKNGGYEIAVKEYFFTLMIYLSGKYMPENKTVNDNFQDIERSKSYLEMHYTERLLIRELAQMANISERHYTRMFKQIYGETPLAYIIKCRLDHACALLQESRKTITEISEECGFPDMASFSKIFKRAYGSSPKDYRKNKKLGKL